MNWLRLCALVAVLSVSSDAAAEPRQTHALWVWDTARLLDDQQQRQTFLDFCERHGVTMIWAYVGTHETTSGRQVSRALDWNALLAGAHARSMEVHALDGDPHYALRAKHDVALSTVDAVIAYNQTATAAERFDGVHFDIEPYLLNEWKDQGARERLLADYLELNERATARAHENGLVYGVDLPFWWQLTDQATGEATSITNVRGVRRSAVDRLLEIVDNLGLMDYRTFAVGPDGLIENALATIGPADRIGKALIVVGVETDDVAEARAKVTFAGTSLATLNTALTSLDAALRGHPSYAGTAIHCYDSFRRLATETQPTSQSHRSPGVPR